MSSSPIDAPLVSVIMAVHNDQRYLSLAVASLQAQSFRAFEMIVVDDGSTDDSPRLLDQHAAADPRLRVIHQDHRGLTRSLNHALSASRGALIARMDSDDIACAPRLQRQVEFLAANPAVAAVGTSVEFIDREGRVTGSDKTAYSSEYLKWELGARNVIWHPSAMVRRSWLERLGGYDESFPVSQDYDLWSRLLRAGGSIEVLPEVLVHYRRSENQITTRRAQEQAQACIAVVAAHNRWLGGTPVSSPEAECLWNLLGYGRMTSTAVLPAALRIARLSRRSCCENASAATRARIRRATALRLATRAAALTVPDPEAAMRCAFAAIEASPVSDSSVRAWLTIARAWRWKRRARRCGEVPRLG